MVVEEDCRVDSQSEERLLRVCEGGPCVVQRSCRCLQQRLPSHRLSWPSKSNPRTTAIKY